MKSFLLIGMGKFGHFLCRSLAKMGNEVMIADNSETEMSDLLDCVVSAKIGDCTKSEVLRSFGPEDFDACVVCIGENFQNSLEVTYLLSELGAKRIISLAYTEIHAKFLLRNGANEVVFPDFDMAERMAVSISSDSIFDYFEISDDYSIFEITPPRDWIGKTIEEVNVRANYHISILATKADDSISSITISPKYVFKHDEHLMVLGKNEDVKKMVDKQK